MVPSDDGEHVHEDTGDDTGASGEGEPSAEVNCDDLQRAWCHAEKRCSLGVVAELLDDLGAKVGDTTVSDVGGEDDQEKEVETWVEHGFLELVPLPLGVVDTGLVLLNAVHGHLALALVEVSDRSGRVGHEEPHHDTECQCDAGQDQVHLLPHLELGGLLHLESVGNASAEDLCPPVVGEPDRSACDLLLLGVESTGKENVGRSEGPFKYTEEESCCQELAIVLASCMCAERDGPEDDADGDVAREAHLLEEESVDGGGDEVADVEEGAEPRVLLPLEIGVLLEAKERGIVERSLVEELQQHRDAQEGHDDEIDLAQHLFELCRSDGRSIDVERLRLGVLAVGGRDVGRRADFTDVRIELGVVRRLHRGGFRDRHGGDWSLVGWTGLTDF
ncbi:hypothetical protein L1887_48417 [Cichorium endivia]|nr:hypothetical protein L1887_48417 [Cichorium endivia]